MSVIVRIPTPLQKFTSNLSEVAVESGTIREIMEHLETQYPGIKERLCDESGQLRRFVNVYLNEEDIRFMQNEDTPAPDGSEVSIVPAIAGGAPAA
jgi:molybdopterin synthase sulfur carrier subunit